jgi:hypothetical protein
MKTIKPMKPQETAKRERERKRETPRVARIVSGAEVDPQGEIDYISTCAGGGEGRIVTLGMLVFFSTSDGHAWMLDAEDGFAYCLMENFEPRGTPLRSETTQDFSIEWDSRFTLEEGCFFSMSNDGRFTAHPTFPAAQILEAVEMARGPAQARS